MAKRVCPRPGCPKLINPQQRYCPDHQREYDTRRGTPTQRGYGADHRALRAAWQDRIDAGEVIYCADGCGARITGRAWQLGHDHQRGGYIGPQTIACNTREGGRRGRASQG